MLVVRFTGNIDKPWLFIFMYLVIVLVLDVRSYVEMIGLLTQIAKKRIKETLSIFSGRKFRKLRTMILS